MNAAGPEDSVEHLVGPEMVWPVPVGWSAQKRSGLLPGPTMAGDVKPSRNGWYLRYFDDVGDWAWSKFSGGKWLRDGFFESDVQSAPWRGGVRPNL